MGPDRNKCIAISQGAGVGAFLWLAMASTAYGDDVRHYDIAPQPLDAVLTGFADRAGLKLLFPAELVKGLKSPGLSGDMAPEEALRKLLSALLWAVLPTPSWLLADYRTAAGETLTVRLEDGSTVMLDGASALDVDWRQDQRRLRLVQGEAYFQVAPDKARPFRVGTAHGTVTALGTAFDVRVGEAFTRVGVTEHSVAVDAGGQPAVTVGEGRQLELDGQGAGPVLATDTDAITAWRRGRLVFQEIPLGEVVAELNRHHPGRIWIADSAIAGRQVNGVFHTDDAMGALAVIEDALQLRSTRLSDYLILLHR